MSEPLHDYDPAEALNSAEAIEVFMADAMETRSCTKSQFALSNKVKTAPKRHPEPQKSIIY